MGQQVIRTEYEDGQVVLSNIRRKKEIPVIGMNDTYTATKVTTWYDGSVMNDSKADGFIYLKHRGTNEYFRVNLPNWGETFLEKDAIVRDSSTPSSESTVRELTSTEILLLKMKYYKGVKVSGYYKNGDTPGAIEYILSTTSETDEGGSVIEVGGIKLEHVFTDGVDPRYYGAKSNEDETGILEKTIIKHKIINISAPYYVDGDGFRGGDGKIEYGGIKVPSNRIINFIGDGILKKVPTETPYYSIFNLVKVDNIVINNINIEGDVENHTGTTGEWGHGVNMEQASNIFINGGNVNKCWGDGICVGTGPNIGDLPSENVNILNVKGYYNRRQGLSITGCINYRVDNCDFSYTGQIKFTAPGYGIDIEPNQVKDERTSGTITNLRTSYNYGGGLTLVPAYLQDSRHDQSHRVFEFKLDGWYSLNDNYNSENMFRGAFRLSGADYSLPNINQSLKIDGFMTLNNVVINNANFYAIQIARFNDSGLKLTMNNVEIRNPNSSNQTVSPVAASGISFSNTQSQQLTYGQVEINNLRVIDDRATPQMSMPIHLETLMADKFKNVTINNLDVDNYKSAYKDNGQYVLGNRTEESISIKLDKTFVDTSTSNRTLSGYRGFKYRVKNRKVLTLPDKRMSGYEITIYNDTTNNEVFVLSSSDSTILYSGYDGTRGLAVPLNGYIKFRLNNQEIWEVVGSEGTIYFQGQRLSGTTAQRPTANMKVSDVGFKYDDTTLGKPIWWNGTSWIELNQTPNATTTVKGLVNQSAALANISQADLVATTSPVAVTDTASSATDVAGLVTDFNDLVGKYNVAVALLNELKTKYDLNVTLTNAIKTSQNTELTNQRTAGIQATT